MPLLSPRFTRLPVITTSHFESVSPRKNLRKNQAIEILTNLSLCCENGKDIRAAVQICSTLAFRDLIINKKQQTITSFFLNCKLVLFLFLKTIKSIPEIIFTCLLIYRDSRPRLDATFLSRETKLIFKKKVMSIKSGKKYCV